MGVDDWEDFKKGLWMFRGFYQTSFVNDLTFEVIWVPADFKAVSPSPEGTMYNSTYTGGFTSQLFNKWDEDLVDPKGLSDSQGGFRIRGFNFDWDWTLIFSNGYDPGPVVIDWGQPSTVWFRTLRRQALGARKSHRTTDSRISNYHPSDTQRGTAPMPSERCNRPVPTTM